VRKNPLRSLEGFLFEESEDWGAKDPKQVFLENRDAGSGSFAYSRRLHENDHSSPDGALLQGKRSYNRMIFLRML
jgi:hypothetical protein